LWSLTDQILLISSVLVQRKLQIALSCYTAYLHIPTLLITDCGPLTVNLWQFISFGSSWILTLMDFAGIHTSGALRPPPTPTHFRIHNPRIHTSFETCSLFSYFGIFCYLFIKRIEKEQSSPVRGWDLRGMYVFNGAGRLSFRAIM